MLKTTLSTVLAFFVAGPVLAETQHSPHSVGLVLGSGGAEYKNSDEDGNGVDHLYLYYHYSLNEQFGLEAGLLGGTEGSDWDCHDDDRDHLVCRNNRKPIFGLDAEDLEYRSLVAAATAQFPLSQRNSLYGKLGAQYYDYEISRGSINLADDSGLGLYLEAGWQYRWDSGWGMNVGLKHLPMGDLKVNSGNVGVSYRF
ncbi:porin family protein [Bowmanella dokdonensis]|uniref:Porin family protein n=1 Tax=Bowmanella dokdonensis TaxID=751969 RepID=A0A939DQZ1_9ALTE|nr:porin family protein [Bowmanella dokdonensis]MBN7827165.1 porin family protein [Bowmanella dokdonensis]